VSPIDDCVLEAGALESGLVHLLQSPVERHAGARLDLLASAHDGGRGEQVQRAYLVLDAVLVE
jgi:hypothetical protein